MCQPEADLGEERGWLHLRDASCDSPDRSAVVWKEADGKVELSCQPPVDLHSTAVRWPFAHAAVASFAVDLAFRVALRSGVQY